MPRADIFTTLRGEILDGTLKAGTQLKEVALAERFGVSRTPVRDALFRLEEAGLLERGARGLEVRGMDPQAVIQVYDLRILLEVEVCGQAALNRSLSDILRMEALLERDRQLGPDTDDRVLIDTNIEFHEAIWEAANNPVLKDILNRLYSHLVHAPTSTLGVGDRWEKALGEHAELISAIHDRDAERARTVARSHFEQAREIRLGLLRDAAIESAVGER